MKGDLKKKGKKGNGEREAKGMRSSTKTDEGKEMENEWEEKQSKD